MVFKECLLRKRWGMLGYFYTVVVLAGASELQYLANKRHFGGNAEVGGIFRLLGELGDSEEIWNKTVKKQINKTEICCVVVLQSN